MASFDFWLCDVTQIEMSRFDDLIPSLLTYELIMDSDWAGVVEDNDNNTGQKYPLQGRTEFNSGSINSFITICDYEEEKRIPHPFFNVLCPQGIPRNYGTRTIHIWPELAFILLKVVVKREMFESFIRRFKV